MKKQRIIISTEHGYLRRLARELEASGKYELTKMPFSIGDAFFGNTLSGITAVIVGCGRDIGTYTKHTEQDSAQIPLIFVLTEPSVQEELIAEAGFIPLLSDHSLDAAVSRIAYSLERRALQDHERKTALINRFTADILEEICITPDCAGYHFLRDAIKLCAGIRAPYSLRRDIYETISTKHNTTINAVDHSIRSTIEKSWTVCPAKSKRKYFGVLCLPSERKPRPKEYIVFLSEWISRMLPEDLH